MTELDQLVATRGKRTMQVEPGLTLRTLRAEYKAACAASNEIIAKLATPTPR